uniref:Collagen-like protein n=1 Tax=Panagrolaimus sp. ES5 TaxID=591445 RepID=A0AC34F2N2_9BILA
MFDKVSTTVKISAENPNKLEVHGHRIVISKVYDEIAGTIVKNGNITEIEINVNEDLILDKNLKFNGKNLVLIAKNQIVISNPITCDLSGRDAINDSFMINRAGDGIIFGENGLDGKDGTAGEPSGNMTICAKEINFEEKLTVFLNGGNGSNGQNGGNGVDGADGVGAKFEEVFGTGHTARKYAKQFANTISFAALSRIFDNNIKLTKTPKGITHYQSDSAHYASTHTFEFFCGAEGKPGGKGGKNGCSGEGGKKGKLDILAGEYEKESVINEPKDGKDGYPGIPGENGENGKDGWDVAMLWISFNKALEYGKNHQQKLSFMYSDVKSDKSVYVKELDKGPKSKCWAQITAVPCTRKFLQEKRTEFKKDSERSGEAIAVKATAIDLEAVTQKHLSLSHLVGTDATETDQQVDAEATENHEIGRIMELWEPFIEQDYMPKERVKLPLLSSEYIEN